MSEAATTTPGDSSGPAPAVVAPPAPPGPSGDRASIMRRWLRRLIDVVAIVAVTLALLQCGIVLLRWWQRDDALLSPPAPLQAWPTDLPADSPGELSRVFGGQPLEWRTVPLDTSTQTVREAALAALTKVVSASAPLAERELPAAGAPPERWTQVLKDRAVDRQTPQGVLLYFVPGPLPVVVAALPRSVDDFRPCAWGWVSAMPTAPVAQSAAQHGSEAKRESAAAVLQIFLPRAKHLTDRASDGWPHLPEGATWTLQLSQPGDGSIGTFRDADRGASEFVGAVPVDLHWNLRGRWNLRPDRAWAVFDLRQSLVAGVPSETQPVGTGEILVTDDPAGGCRGMVRFRESAAP